MTTRLGDRNPIQAWAMTVKAVAVRYRLLPTGRMKLSLLPHVIFRCMSVTLTALPFTTRIAMLDDRNLNQPDNDPSIRTGVRHLVLVVA